MNSENFSLETDDASLSSSFREWPIVSVIVATHRRGKLLRRALDSVLAQTYRDYECWVIHDGPLGVISDDGIFTAFDAECAETANVYEEYRNKFDAIGVDFYPVALEEHTGYYTTPRNAVTENCRGVYVANLDDDNEWLPDALESLVAAIEEGEEWPDLVYGRRRYVLDEGAPSKYGDIDLRTLSGDSAFVPWDAEAMVRIAGNQPMFNFIDSSDFLVSKGALYRLGIKAGHIWNDSKRRFGDFYLVSDGLLVGEWKFKALDKVVQIYHVTGDNVSLTRPVHEIPFERKV